MPLRVVSVKTVAVAYLGSAAWSVTELFWWGPIAVCGHLQFLLGFVLFPYSERLQVMKLMIDLYFNFSFFIQLLNICRIVCCICIQSVKVMHILGMEVHVYYQPYIIRVLVLVVEYSPQYLYNLVIKIEDKLNSILGTISKPIFNRHCKYVK